MHHLTKANEIFGQVLLSTVNLAYYQTLMGGAETIAQAFAVSRRYYGEWEQGDLRIIGRCRVVGQPGGYPPQTEGPS